MKTWLRKVDSFFNGMVFIQKCFILFFFGAFLPLAIQNVVYYWQTERNIQEEMLQKANEGMDDKADRVESALSEVLFFARSYGRNEMLYESLDHEYSGDLEVLIQYQEKLREFFVSNLVATGQISGINIYTENMTMFDNYYVKTMEEVDVESLGENLSYLNLEPLEGEDGVWLRIAQEDGRVTKAQGNRSISILYRMDYYRQYAKYKKMVRLDMDREYLKSILKESNLFDNMFLVDSKGRVIAAASDYSDRGVPEVFDNSLAEGKKNLLLLKRTVGGFPLVLYGIYNSEPIAGEFAQGRQLTTGVSILCLLFALLCVYLISNNINQRLRRLAAQSEEIARGNFIQVQTPDGGKDEISVLQQSINQMGKQLKELIEKEYRAEIRRMELEKETDQAKLLALQAQVNPHFMFNALESIRLRALAKGERETAGVIKYMAKMFRHILDWKDNVITLREEISFLDEFLYIQNYRFEDEFSYEIDISGEAYDCRIPKMILQPLVENACVHGVEAISENRWVKIEACIRHPGQQADGPHGTEDILEIRVADNGGGMPEEKQKKLRDMLQKNGDGSQSVGIWNVYRRLVLYYGDHFTFDISSTPGKGTTCTLRIPTGTAGVLGPEEGGKGTYVHDYDSGR